MSDLIRREDVIKLVNQFVFGLCKEQNDEVRRTFNKYIEKMPTAYDIDKVVERLEKIQDKAVSVKNEDISIYATGMMGKAIEIVKQGGLSDDVCEWKLEDEEANLYLTECQQRQLIFDGTPKENGYRYCPYCGKKIKVVE